MKQDTLTDLLALAVPKPAHIANSDGGAALALALHCLMVRDGFTVEEAASSSGRRQRSSYAPPAEWNGRFSDEWVFSYTKDGKANKFVLHCSLQSASRRMYVHSSELGNLPNVQVLGLLVDNYVPDAKRLKSNEWAGVLQQEGKLVEMFSAYITQPLTDNAEATCLSDSEPGSPLHREGQGRGWHLGSWLPEGAGVNGSDGGSKWAVLAAGVVLAAAVGAALYYRAGSRPRQRLLGLAGGL